MSRSACCIWILSLVFTPLYANQTHGQESAPPTQELPTLRNPVEIQSRGPLHEAYAQPFASEPGPQAPKEPPPAINELPPEESPADSQWIPGYWSWDADRQDFIWVSGVARIPPQGRKFVPGYWTKSTEGWRWVSGLWASAQQEELPITPAPPAPLELGPSMPAPDENAGYVPGGWVYREDRFSWRPGYYASMQPGRVWVPARYNWTPNGYLYADGYWDYPFEARGLAYAPAYFNRSVYRDPNYAYQPRAALDPALFLDLGFVLGNSFYFGDYSGPNHSRHGYRPWHAGVGRYDPLFSYHRWRDGANTLSASSGIQRHGARPSGQRQLALTTPHIVNGNPAQRFASVNAPGSRAGSQVVAFPGKQAHTLRFPPTASAGPTSSAHSNSIVQHHAAAPRVAAPVHHAAPRVAAPVHHAAPSNVQHARAAPHVDNRASSHSQSHPPQRGTAGHKR